MHTTNRDPTRQKQKPLGTVGRSSDTFNVIHKRYETEQKSEVRKPKALR